MQAKINAALKEWHETKEVNWCQVKNSKIVNFYKNKNILVTGGTGFLGKLLIEKLLRACPDISTLYILIRPKKGEDVDNRLKKIFNNEIFGPLRKINPNFFQKICLIKGDIAQPNLGLTLDDINLIQNQINVIFHVAATVNFEEKITTATAINVRGTIDLIKIAHKCKQLQSFVYVSTAYSNCNRFEIDEVFYKTPITADELMSLVENTPEDVLIEKTPKLLCDWPNIYTFTKAIAEDAINHYGKNLPICMVRPSIILATAWEPLRGWIDNYYGSTGLMIGGGTGVLHVFQANGDAIIDQVPGDYVINCIIAASYQTANQTTLEPKIYNYVSSVENPTTLDHFSQESLKWGLMFPSIRTMWYYSFFVTKSYYFFLLSHIFLHYLPGLILDSGLLIMRKKPFMTRMYNRISKFLNALSYFSLHEWKFHNDNTRGLWNSLNDDDKKAFSFSMKEIDWDSYRKANTIGIRTWLMKDDLSTLPKARKKFQRLYIAHMTVKGLFYTFIIFTIYWVFTKLLFNYK